MKKLSPPALWQKKNLPYAIIGVLALIILVGMLYIFTSSPGASVEVAAFNPTGEVAQGTNFTIEFSRPLIADSLVSSTPEQTPVKFTPTLAGKFVWIEANKLRFYPEVLLKPSTEYTAAISPRIAAIAGYTLSGQTEFRFHTERFAVNSAHLTYEYQPESPEHVRLAATIEFNYEVDPEQTAKHLRVKLPGGDDVLFRIETASPSRIIQLESDQVPRGQKEKQIELTIQQGLNCVAGNLPLERDYTKPLIVPGQEPLRLVRMTPRTTSADRAYIQFAFNLPIQVESAKEHIEVSPQIEFNARTSHHYVELHGEFKPGNAYQVYLRQGLLAIDGTPLEQDISNRVSFIRETIPPQVGFVGEGYYLTRQGHLNVGLSTINVNKVSLEIDKIYANNLVYLLNTHPLESRYRWINLESIGQRVHESELIVQTVQNEEVVTPLPLREYMANGRKGIYRLTARLSDRRWQQSSKWVVATDMGMVTKKAGEDLWVWVNNLSDLTPVNNARIQLISQNNQTLVTARTNADGLAIIKNYTTFTDEFVPYLITASTGDDFSFLELARRRIPTSDFDVDGQLYLQNGYEAFLYNERGVYRPGETAHVAAIVRGRNASLPGSFPLRLQVKAPDSRVLAEQRTNLNEQGSAEFSITIPDYALTGKYTALLLLGEDDEIGRTTFSVEEFVPDRMKVTLLTDKEIYAPAETMQIDVSAVTLFGPPAANRRVQAEIEIEHHLFEPENWRSFSFNDKKKNFSKITKELGEKTSNENGQATYQYTITKDLQPPSGLRGIVTATVLEPGGRGVSAYRSVLIHPYESYVGLRKAKEGYAEPNQPAKIEYVVVNPAGESQPSHTLEVSFYRVYWQSILKKSASARGYRYVSDRVEKQIEQFEVNSEPGIGSFEVTPADYGRYRVAVTDKESGASSSLTFYASGWGYAPWAMDQPDRIELDLDKERYRAGETAQVQIRAPFAGKVLLTVERDNILDHQVLTLEENTATMEVPIREAYKPNVYVSAHLIRSTDGLERNETVRAFGVVPLFLDTDDNKLAVELNAPDEIRPNSRLPVQVQVSGQRNRPYVTIAAVDEGICQLTEFETPDPHSYFFGKKRLQVESFDIYGVVLPEITSSSLTSVAGDVEAARKRQLTPVSVTRFKPVAFWSGLLKTDGRGRGTVSFDMPQFNGSVRLMAVAFAGDRFGSSQQNVFVREPIVMTPTFPRFISSRDSFIAPVNVYNGTGANGAFEVMLRTEGPVRIDGDMRKTVSIPAGKEKPVYFSLQAEPAIGEVKFTLSATGNGESAQMEIDVPLRPPAPQITLSGYGSVDAAQPQRFKFPADWYENTAEFRLTVSSFPVVQFAGSLQYLLSYPHGCIEQTTSKVFPLLTFNEVARVAEPELFAQNNADYYVEQGIAKLEGMQLSSGAFSFWPGDEHVNNWSTVYASHFLVEARRAGYVVSDRVHDKLIEMLRHTTRSFKLSDKHLTETAVYASYVLALAGEPDKSTMLFLKNNAVDELRQHSKYQLAGAFAHAGDLQTARSLLPTSVVSLPDGDQRETGGVFHSSTRAHAIMLDVLAEVDADHAMVPVLVKNLTAAATRHGRWRTTQENAYAFLALGKILKQKQDANYTGKISIDGQQLTDFAAADQTFGSQHWAGKEVALELQGDGTCYYYWQASGIPARQAPDEFDRDLKVRRRYLDKNGNQLQHGQIKQGDLVIAELAVTAEHETLQNVAVVDMLPAGLEIENPRLQSRRAVDWLSERVYTPQYMDIRDDRMILYGRFPYGRTEKFYYGLRAVTQGSFILPPVRAEAMYAPEKASVASSGKIVVAGL